MTPIQSIPPLRASEVNAVSIQINNPKVITSNETKSPEQKPATVSNPQIYTYPQAPIYEVPKQSIYQVQPVKEAPNPPAPVIVRPTPAKTAPAAAIQAVPAKAEVPGKEAVPVKAETPAPATQPQQTQAPAQKVEVKAPEKIEPKVDINEFITKLSTSDYEQQAKAMESIALMAQNSPQQATALLDVKVIDTLLGIMQKDTSKLEGPSAKQIEAREKIMKGKSVSDADKAEANKITPMELAERNKQYSMYTLATLQKLFISEVNIIDGSTVPLTELPGASAIVEQVKTNPNPMIKAAGIDALSYIQQPDYKQDLTTIFSVAKNDKDANVQKAATKALEKLSQLKDTTVTAAVDNHLPPTKPQTQAEAVKPAAEPAKKEATPVANAPQLQVVKPEQAKATKVA